jgi:sulfite reductase alpha subunit-like flavoprotein
MAPEAMRQLIKDAFPEFHDVQVNASNILVTVRRGLWVHVHPDSPPQEVEERLSEYSDEADPTSNPTPSLLSQGS